MIRIGISKQHTKKSNDVDLEVKVLLFSGQNYKDTCRHKNTPHLAFPMVWAVHFELVVVVHVGSHK